MRRFRLARLATLSSTSIALVALSSSSCGTSAAPPASGAPLQADSPWPKFRGGAAQDGASPVNVHAHTTGGAAWSFRTGKGIFSSPVVGEDGTVYIGSADRTFYALDPATGTLRWSVATGEIIDSAALLDDRGRVYFGSGDGKLRALDAKTGAPVWTMSADPPAVNKAFINWFEGNVAIGPSGTLYVPNDNFFVYAVDRETGAPRWRFKTPDQTWSLPAIDTRDETLFVGNNNLLPLLGKNTFAVDRDGGTTWDAVSLGSVAASPMLADGAVVVGGFDGYVRSFDAATGELRWAAPTRDHVYASPARLPDGTIVQPSTDGTIYALDPATGAQRWAFDTREPIRSSPAVDADGNVYVGSGEGRLFVLRADGTLRWSLRLVDEDRNDLNSSPALGRDAIYLGGESGEVFSVPYDFCLRAEAASDARCVVGGGEDLPAEGASLLYTSPFGRTSAAPPAPQPANQPITLSLVVRAAGDTTLALLDATTLAVTLDPPVPAEVEVSGDGKFVTVTPDAAFAAGPTGAVHVAARGKYLVGFTRQGLRLSGGVPGGDLALDLDVPLTPPPASPPSFVPGDRWEVTRLALPLPTLMPSYNQIGFDSLHYLFGLVEVRAGHAVGWMTGALPDGTGGTAEDPATKALFPLDVTLDGDLVTLAIQDGLRVEVTNVALPFKTFRIAARIGATGDADAAAVLSGSTVCAGVPFYGLFLQQLGMCNPQTDVIRVFGGARMTHLGAPGALPPAGDVTFDVANAGVTAMLRGSSLTAASGVASILLVDTQTGKPVTLEYGLDSTRTMDASGVLTAVSVPFGTHAVPKEARVYLMIGTRAVASSVIAIP